MQRSAAIVFTALLLSVPVTGGAAGGELTGGYSFTRSDGQSYHGGRGGLNWRLSGRLGIEIDVANHYGPDSVTLLSFAAGPRYTLVEGDTRVFVHGLVGGLRSRASISVFGVTISKSETNLAALFGGGIDRRLSGHWGLRISGEYLGVDAAAGWQSQPRASLGVSYRFGAGAANK